MYFWNWQWVNTITSGRSIGGGSVIARLQHLKRVIIRQLLYPRHCNFAILGMTSKLFQNLSHKIFWIHHWLLLNNMMAGVSEWWAPISLHHWGDNITNGVANNNQWESSFVFMSNNWGLCTPAIMTGVHGYNDDQGQIVAHSHSCMKRFINEIIERLKKRWMIAETHRVANLTRWDLKKWQCTQELTNYTQRQEISLVMCQTFLYTKYKIVHK